MNKQIETYLHNATRGLWGLKRREVKEELSTHIEGRIYAHLIAGLTEAEATEKTLAELGQPKMVSTGMARLYTLPLVALSSFLLASIFALSIFLLPRSTAQLLEILPVFPSEYCLQNIPTEGCKSMEIWLNLDELVTTLESQGVKVIQDEHALGLIFPTSETTVYLHYTSRTTNTIEISYNKTLEMPALPGYISLWQFIQTFIGNASAPTLRISNWNPITLSVGQVSFEVKHDEKMAENFYLKYLTEIQSDLYKFSFPKEFNSTFYPREFSSIKNRITMPEATNDMYGIIQLDSVRDNDYRFTLFVNPDVGPGQLAFYGPLGPLRFLGKTDPIEEHKRTALLIRMTGEVKNGKLGYEIISPERFTLE